MSRPAFEGGVLAGLMSRAIFAVVMSSKVSRPAFEGGFFAGVMISRMRRLRQGLQETVGSRAARTQVQGRQVGAGAAKG